MVNLGSMRDQVLPASYATGSLTDTTKVVSQHMQKFTHTESVTHTDTQTHTHTHNRLMAFFPGQPG